MVVYRAKNVRIVSMSQYLWTWLYTIESKKKKYVTCIDRISWINKFLPNFACLFTFLHRNEKLNSLILPNTSARTLHILFKELLNLPLSACSVPIATVPSPNLSIWSHYIMCTDVCVCVPSIAMEICPPVCLIIMFALFIFSNLLISSLHFLIHLWVS